ncbi:hypothetical protein BH10BAC5_BH10BAC5_15200 [soil metagenome]
MPKDKLLINQWVAEKNELWGTRNPEKDSKQTIFLEELFDNTSLYYIADITGWY